MNNQQIELIEVDKVGEAASDVENRIDDLSPKGEVSGGFDPKATDVTLKRGIID